MDQVDTLIRLMETKKQGFVWMKMSFFKVQVSAGDEFYLLAGSSGSLACTYSGLLP